MNVEKIFAESPTFETERLFLRKMHKDDAMDYFNFASNSLVTLHTMWETHRSLDDSKRYIEDVLQKYAAKEAYHWGIINKSTNKLIGRTGFISWDAVHQRTEIGFGLATESWNKGMITEATKEIIRYGFVNLNLNRIEGRCNHNNVGSARVMEKLGMKCEGILREQLKMKGDFVDQRMYSIIRKEYTG